MKRYRFLLMVTALAVAAPALAGANEDAKAKAEKVEKAEKADKADKDAAKGKDKDKSASDPAATADPNAPADSAAAAAQEERDDAVLDPAQPDFTVITMPTTLRMPKYKSAFRVTHRFARALGEGGFGDLADDLFGLDASGVIGLEFRFGLRPGWQVGINRTNSRDIQFFTQYDIKSQSESFPLGIAAYATFEGTNNLHDDEEEGIQASYRPSIGVVLSRSIAKHAALYVMPVWVNNTNEFPSELVDDNNTFLLGVGGRVRVGGTTYFVMEVVPRVGGFDPGVNHVSFGVEKRVGGHSFQLNFSNALGTTMAQVAHGGLRDENGNQQWFMGFNITRKFF